MDITSFAYYDSVNHQCVESCAAGYFANGLNCTACATLPCANCSGTATNCTSCSTTSGYPYLNISGSSGTCLSNCSSGMYPDTSTSISQCVNCSSICSTCKNATYC